MKIEAARSATVVCGLIIGLAAAFVQAQAQDPPAGHNARAASNVPVASIDTAKVQQDLARLRDQVRQLDQRLRATAPDRMQQSGEMTMGRDQKNASMTQPAQSGMKMPRMRMMEVMRSRMGDDDMMGMGAMGGMQSPAAMATPSALPGFPGQSHLYHIGATGFFLDHSQHITLTTQQQQMLAQHKQQSLLRRGELQRQIDAAEEKLWQLTGADQPQIGSIEQQVREIERLRAERRIAFIQDVGEAAKVLTVRQREQLTGMAPVQSADPMSMPDSNPPKSGGKDHM